MVIKQGHKVFGRYIPPTCCLPPTYILLHAGFVWKRYMHPTPPLSSTVCIWLERREPLSRFSKHDLSYTEIQFLAVDYLLDAVELIPPLCKLFLQSPPEKLKPLNFCMCLILCLFTSIIMVSSLPVVVIFFNNSPSFPTPKVTTATYMSHCPEFVI